MERLKARFAQARRALDTLRELVVLDRPSQVERDAAIQRFEYSFEALWKTVQRYLTVHEGIEVASPKAVFREALKAGLLGEDEAREALQMCDDSNLTSHPYNEALAALIHSRLKAYQRLMAQLLERIASRMAP